MVMDWPRKTGSGLYSTRACLQILQVGWGLHLILSSFFLHVSPLLCYGEHCRALPPRFSFALAVFGPWMSILV